MQRRNKGRGSKLAPLDGGSSHGGKQQRRIFEKRDLVEAVRRLSPGRRSHSTPQLQNKNNTGNDTNRSNATDSGNGNSNSMKKGHSTKHKAKPSRDEDSSGSSTLQALEAGVNMHARRYNELKVQADQKQRDLEKLLDKLHALEIENTALKNMQSAKTTEAARIKKLEAECKEIQGSMENKSVYRAQLDHMHERLTSNVMKFGAHIKAMEEQLRSSRKEHKEVKLLLRQLEQGKTEAIAELQSTVKRLEQDRKMRARELGQRQKEAENAKRLEDWREQREKRKLELQAELRGDLSKEEEEELIEKLKKREGQSAKLRAASIDRNKKAMTLEDAFAQIRQATGVTSLSEMVEKFMGQGTSKEALLEEKAAAERKLAEVLKAKKDGLNKFNSMKAQVAQTGIGGLELNREIYDKLDEEILGAKAELKLNRATCDRLEKSLVAVRQGAKGLAQRMEPFKDLLTHEEEVELPKTDIEALDLLIECEAKLLKMLERLDVDDTGAVVPGSPAPGGMSSLPGSPTKQDGAGSPGMDGTKKAQTWTPFDNEDPEMHSYNIRITRRRQPGGKLVGSTIADDISELGIDMSMNGGGDDDDEEDDVVPDRSQLKRKARKTLAVGMGARGSGRGGGGGGGGDGDGGGKKGKGRSKKDQEAAAARMMGRGSPKKNANPTFLTTKPDLD
tara:strand:- start:198 stop:2222 length:2025 start_codon:yes stop_codon:yes gene_type:complete